MRLGRPLALAALTVLLIVPAPARASGGGVVAFGLNLYGSLGSTTNNGTTHANPTPTAVTLPAGAGPVVAAAIGGTSLVLTSAGQVYAFGANHSGELGSSANLGTSAANPTPALVTFPGESGPVTKVAEGQSASYAVTSSGQLYAFGANSDGELGTAANSGTSNATPTPTLVTPAGTTVVDVSAGADHTLVLTSTGQVYAFGDNFYGQLGNATDNNADAAHPTPAPVTLPGPARAIAAGNLASYVVTTAGGLYSFGDDGNGQLGRTSPNEANPVPTLVTLPGATGDVRDVSAGTGHVLAVTSTDQLYAFGSNHYGELGVAATSGTNANPTPALVSLPGQQGTIAAIAAPGDHSLVTTSAGQLYAFGDNAYGELGATTNSGTSTPNPTPAVVTLPGGDPATAPARGQSSDSLVVTGSTGVDIGAGDPVDEPASGTVPQAFTVTLPETSASDTVIHYRTVDGTGTGAATAAAGNYTAVASGTLTIPAGQTTGMITVQVGAGNGTATTPQLTYDVELTSSSGAPLGTASAHGIVIVPGITGKLTDGGVGVEPNVDIALTGTAATGQSVTRHVLTDGGGRYQVAADPGTYSLTPTPPNDATGYVAVGCPGTADHGVCANFTLAPGASLTTDFKLLTAVVNSTDVAEDAGQAAKGICDATPSADTTACTLPEAIDVANAKGGGTIGFDIPGGGVPRIATLRALPIITVPVTLDGTTQPGSGQVEITTGADLDAGLELAGGHSIVRGLVVSGFCRQIQVDGADGNTIQGDVLGTDPTGTILVAHQGFGCVNGAAVFVNGASGTQVGGPGPGQPNDISASGGDGIVVLSAHDTVIQGNRIGAAGVAAGAAIGVDATHREPGRAAIRLAAAPGAPPGGGNTVGGATPGTGNVIGGGSVDVEEPADVLQGNQLTGTDLEVRGDHDTIGGAAPTPGTGAGNDIESEAEYTVFVTGFGDVLQGNRVRAGGAVGIFLTDSALNATVGGPSDVYGNLVGQADSGLVPLDGIDVSPSAAGDVAGPARHDVIAHNEIRNVTRDGVEVNDGTAVQISENRMSAVGSLGIHLGNAPFQFDGLSVSRGPNNREQYPNLLESTKGRTVHATLRLAEQRRHAVYTVELFSDHECAQDSITPGLGAHPLASGKFTTDGTGFAELGLSFPRMAATGDGALTATATASDGSTSEFSPCLTIGRRAPLFVKDGVEVRSRTVDVSAPAASQRGRARAAGTKTTKGGLHGAIGLLCPPATTRFCKGTLSLTSGHTAIAHATLALAPGELRELPLTVTPKGGALLKRKHSIRVASVLVARDDAKPPHHRTTRSHVTLRLVAKGKTR